MLLDMHASDMDTSEMNASAKHESNMNESGLHVVSCHLDARLHACATKAECHGPAVQILYCCMLTLATCHLPLVSTLVESTIAAGDEASFHRLPTCRPAKIFS